VVATRRGAEVGAMWRGVKLASGEDERQVSSSSSIVMANECFLKILRRNQLVYNK
jgi:hypothetical protein